MYDAQMCAKRMAFIFHTVVVIVVCMRFDEKFKLRFIPTQDVFRPKWQNHLLRNVKSAIAHMKAENSLILR